MNGLVGMVSGLGFAVTSVFSGLSVGQLGMGWTLAIAVLLTWFALAHVATERHEQRRRHTAVGARDAGVGRDRERAGDARHVVL